MTTVNPSPPRPKKFLSITSFVIAVLSPVIPGPGFIYSAIAAILGHIAYFRERESRVWSLLGIVLGWLGVIVGLLIFFIVVPLLFGVIGLLPSLWEELVRLFSELTESS